MKTKLFLFSFFAFASSMITFSQGVWIPKTNFGSMGRLGAVGFSIGTRGYIGTGFNGLGVICYPDFWEWNQATNVWTQKANFGGTARGYAVGFSIGTKGYIGTGWDGIGYNQDFWEWDQTTNIWIQRSNFGGTNRMLAVGFSIGTKGYIGTGVTAFGGVYLQDFWEWDQATNIWIQKAIFSGGVRERAVGFSIGTNGYIGTGWDGIGYNQDFWEWDQTTNIWTQKTNFPGNVRCEAVGFSIGNRGFLGTGTLVAGTSSTNDFWEYDPSTNSWLQKTNVGGSNREFAVGFSIGCRGYIGTGFCGDFLCGPVTNDFWEYYDPTDTTCCSIFSLISGTTTICSGQSTTLIASGGTNYLWSNGAVTSAITVSPAATTSYTVIVSTGNCADTTNCTVNVFSVPVVSVVSNPAATGQVVTITQGQSATLTATGGGTYSWSNAATGSNIIVSPTSTTQYCVTVADANGCKGIACVTVTVEDPCSIAGELYLPNAFSPNNDAENDELCLQGGVDDCIKDLTITIYDRWGKNVYESTDENFCWDGTYKGGRMNSAVFVYYMEATLISEETITKKGNISLLR